MLTKDDPRAANWSLLCAGVLAIQILVLGSLPFELFEPWDKLFHVLAYSAITLLLWIATDGRRRLLVVALVMGLGMVDELRQAAIPARGADLSDFLAGALAAVFTGAVLFWLTRTGKAGQNLGAKKRCAES